jgi:signal transduction histidine kinase
MVPTDILVMADERRLRQVLHNLVGNAVKYSPAGGTITVVARESRTEVAVSVTDQGVGIPRHMWDRIFHPYQRVEHGEAASIDGTGLGLAITKGIIEAHGGRIWVESESGAGSTFSFTLPRAPAPVEGAW